MSENIETIKQIRNLIRSEDLKSLEEIFIEAPELLRIKTVFGTWLHDASRLGMPKVVNLLVKLGIDVNEIGGTFNSNALKTAASAGNLEIVDFLLASGSKMDVSEPDRNPLFSAIYIGNYSIAKLLIDTGMDISIKYTGERMKDMDALAYAEERGELEIAELIRAELAKREKS